MSRIAVFDWSRGGHRGPYLELFSRVIGAEILPVGKEASLAAILRPKVLLFSTCEDYFGRFVFWAFLRRLLGRKSIGVLLRAEWTIGSSTWKHRLKAWLITLARTTGAAHMVTILSHDHSPGSKRVSDGWIWDPQFWDLDILHPEWKRYEIPSSIQREVEQHRAGRMVVLSLGTQYLLKGVLWFYELYQQSEAIRSRFLFVSLGAHHEVPAEALDAFRACGGLAIDYRLTDSELIASYGLADWIWCCYRPDYDLSSGIFGRALQMGKPTIVRQGSYLERVSHLGCGLDIPFGDAGAAESTFLSAGIANHPGVQLNGVDRLKLIISDMGLPLDERA